MGVTFPRNLARSQETTKGMPVIGMPFVVSRKGCLTQPETFFHFPYLFQQQAALLFVEIFAL